MLIRQDIESQLDHFAYDHERDTSGNSYIVDVVGFAKQLPPNELGLLGEILIDRIQRDNYVYAHLAALGEFGDRNYFDSKTDLVNNLLAKKLFALFIAETPLDHQICERFIETLLELRFEEIKPIALRYIDDPSVKDSVDKLIVVCALCHVDSELFLNKASALFAENLCDKGLNRAIQKAVPYALIQLKTEGKDRAETLVTDLIRSTSKLDEFAGERLKSQMLEWLRSDLTLRAFEKDFIEGMAQTIERA